MIGTRVSSRVGDNHRDSIFFIFGSLLQIYSPPFNLLLFQTKINKSTDSLLP